MAEASTPNMQSGTIIIPDGTPEPIRRALEVASTCQFCRLLTPLEEAANGEYAIDAYIGPADEPVDGSASGPAPWYRVRFLIPSAFPFAVVHTVPLEPPLVWYPHQNGDWPHEADRHANTLCPVDLNEIHTDELLLPHIRHAYTWITDALRGALTQPDQRYEFPHIIRRSQSYPIVYAEGGAEVLTWLRQARCGRAWLRRVPDRAKALNGLLLVRELRSIGEQDSSCMWKSHVRDGAFGDEEVAGWAPWAFVGSPVVEPPHRPPVHWHDLPEHVQRRVARATYDVARYRQHVSILLLAFAVPERWSGGPERAVWTAVELDRVDHSDFQAPHGFRPNSDVLKRPPVKQFFARHDPLPWVGICTDISPEALASRRGSPPAQAHHKQQSQIADCAMEGLGTARSEVDAAHTHLQVGRPPGSEPGGSVASGPLSAARVSDLRIAIIGVGALGSMLAKGIAKLEPRELLLVDKESIEPGNLVRHEALASHVTAGKADAMSALLQPITSGRVVRALSYDVVQHWDAVAAHLAACDLVIDATADTGVHARLLESEQLSGTRIALCYAKPGPDFGILVVRRAGSCLALEEVEAALRGGVDERLWGQFVASGQREDGLVWPQPGCYFPTFNAPYHRLHMLADAFLTMLESWLAADCLGDMVTLVRQEEPLGRYGVEQHIAAQISLPSSGALGRRAQEQDGREYGDE